ncbi:hypothetical protein QM012_008410 [Aureobasidium pullulans]|uniref:Telomeric single stranded DNA binding POT1/Cdc13 domain-containing protein n=1 Tax=Aureobasidium pullulans TaxID=5580 RepID=A0ABR0TJC3_AURPU
MQTVPISSLSPSSVLPADCGFKALVTLLWPFSSTTGQCALLLADPDARRRYQKGQVRVRFTGPSARQIAASGIGIGDSVQVALVGVQWLTESDTALVKTPGRSVDGELLFTNRLHMTITRGQTESRAIDVDEPTEHTSPKPVMLPPSTPIARSKPRTSFDAYGVAVYSSPAFMKRLRLSEGGTPYSPVPVSEDDDQDTVASRKRRRVSYRNVSEWKFDAREPSPEKDQIDVSDAADGDEDPFAETAVPETSTVGNGNVAENRQDLDIKDALEPIEEATHQAEQPASKAQGIKENTTQSALDTIAQDRSAETAENELFQTEAEVEVAPEFAAESSSAQELEERVFEAIIQQPADPTKSEETSPGRAPQAPDSTMISQLQISTSLDMPPSSLSRPTILPTESELLEQMARARTIDRPTTPNLQPLLTEGLSLPSPFPTSAQKIPSPLVPNIAEVSRITENKTVPGNAAEIILQQGLDQQLGATSQTPRVVTNTYDGYAEVNPVVLSSGSESEDEEEGEQEKKKKGEAGLSYRSPLAASPGVVSNEQVSWRSRGDRFDDESSADEESDEEMESYSEDSESDDVSSAYNSEQIVALQEQSDEEEAVEEPEWEYLEHKLEQEETALRHSREDLIARDTGLVEVADDLEEEDEAEDAVIHDDNSDFDEEILARSDDDSADDDSDDTAYFDQAMLPDAEDESSEESEVDMMDQSYQPSVPENAMYNHPFDPDGTRTLTGPRTALPSQAVSETSSAVGDEIIAWRDRDAAIEALDQQMRQSGRQLQITEQAVQAPGNKQIPPPSLSGLDVVELLDDTDSDEEEEKEADIVASASRETIDFLPSNEFVNHLLSSNQKDAQLEFSGPVTAQIRSEIKKISDQVDIQSSASTKFNALKIVCKIGIDVAVAAESGNVLAESVKYRLKEDEVLVSVCWRIYNQLSDVDRYHTGQLSDVLAALEELEAKRDYCFQGFSDFLKQFKQNCNDMNLRTKQQQLRQQTTPTSPQVKNHNAPEVESHPRNKGSEQSSTPPLLENQREAVLNESSNDAKQQLSPVVGKLVKPGTESSEQSQTEQEAHAASKETDVDTTLSSAFPAQVVHAPAEDVKSLENSSISHDVEPRYKNDADKFEMMDVEAEFFEPIDEHEIDPALAEGQHEIDPALLKEADSVRSLQPEEYEIDPALLQGEHEIDPALLAEGHDDLQSNSHPSPLQVDDAMSETLEPEAFSVADDGKESKQLNVEEDVTATMTEITKDEPAAQNDVLAVTQVSEDPLESQIPQSVETDPETAETMEVDATPLQASLETTAEADSLHKIKEELRPLSSSSFKTLSPTPDAFQAQPLELDARSTAPDISLTASHMLDQPIEELDQPIEELDLSQVESYLSSRFSRFSQSRSSRAHTRSETIPDSADEEATDLEAENNDISNRPTTPEPVTQAVTVQKTPEELLMQPSQELGTAPSQLRKSRYDASEMQSQLAGIQETTLSADESVGEEMRSQAGLDDELLADYVQIPEAIPALSTSRSELSTPKSSKKPARPLTSFKGRKSDGQQQVLRDEVMQDLSSCKPEAPADERVTVGRTEDDAGARDETDANLVLTSRTIPEPQPQAAQRVQEITETTNAVVATKPEVSTVIEQAPEVEQASSSLQIKPTLKPFAEVEASLFGTPVKDKTAKPQAPQSAPSQSWRHALSYKMSEVPVIGSWFTPRRTTEIQKAATENKPTTRSTANVEDTPTKAAAMPRAKQSSRGRERSISPPPVQRYASQGTSTSLSYFTPLAGLYQHLNQQSSLIDVVAICTSATSTAERAKSGPKDYYTTFRIVDQPLHEYYIASQDEGAKDVRVEIFRPFKKSLPTAVPGDVILLRGFVVRSRNHKSYLLSTAASGWCVWRYGAPPSSLDYEGQEEEDDVPVWARKGTGQGVGDDDVREEVTGPPVEIGDGEREKVTVIRAWWKGLQQESKSKDEGHDTVMID